MLIVPLEARNRMVAHCLAALPLEGCGLLVGDADRAVVASAVGTANAAASALRYEIDASEHLTIDRAASAQGQDVIGAFHSHTHSDAFPSPTDVELAVDPSWHWVVVSLRHPRAILRSFVIRDGVVIEEQLGLPGTSPST